MRPLILSLILTLPALPGLAADCGSIVPSVCAMPLDDPAPVRKVLKVKPTVTPYGVGDRFPVETRSLLMDPARYALRPSDGTWRYYAMGGVVYRVETASARVLEVIRNRHTAHLR
ncbi:MAG: hypothetical protein ACLGIE_10605 [Alphaproteobacteria bacterium]